MAKGWIRKINKAARLWSYPRYRRALRRHGVAAGIEHHGCLFPDFKTVVDVGASIGQFALAALEMWPNARVISFEPGHKAFKRLTNIMNGEDRFSAHNVGIGAVEDTMLFREASDVDQSSFLRVHPSSAHYSPIRSHRDVKVLPLRQVDMDLVAPALLKIDVQGMELEVLKGADLSLFDTLYIEAAWTPTYQGQPFAYEIISWLDERGWRLVHVHHLNRIQADLEFRSDGFGAT